MELQKIYDIFLECNQEICTDTRAVKEGALFIALSGANFNGNEFIAKALDLGCLFAISDEPKYASHENVVLVDDVLGLLQELANFHRNLFKIPVLGITGTNGKTTTKELLTSVLSEKYNVLSTIGNLNNHIGVPLTLLRLRKEHDFAIIEMGANHVGDIKELCEISEPNFGVITNIGKAHLEGFGSFQNIISTKTELYDFVEEAKGHTFVNLNERELVKASSLLSHPIFYGGNSELNFELQKGTELLSLNINNQSIHSKLFGNYNSNNVLTAFKIGDYFEVDEQLIKKALEAYTPTNNRSQRTKTKRGNILILDAYNANPTSMNLAIDEFSELSSDKVYILGEMRELGNISNEEHLKVMDRLSDESNTVFYVGMAFKKFENRYPQNFYANIDKLLASKKLEEISNSNILIKGSRSVKLDTLEEIL
jgi:UDP-N-acetylmuramoyl-tripeptide--D-alanyl-D-alanine ligase